jgi:hypothetical protein
MFCGIVTGVRRSLSENWIMRLIKVKTEDMQLLPPWSQKLKLRICV